MDEGEDEEAHAVHKPERMYTIFWNQYFNILPIYFKK